MGLVEVLTKSATESKPADSPVQGLNAMLSKSNPSSLEGLTAQENDIIEALENGGAYALHKALAIASEGDNFSGGALGMETINNAIRKASYADLEKRGISANSYRSRTLNS